MPRAVPMILMLSLLPAAGCEDGLLPDGEPAEMDPDPAEPSPCAEICAPCGDGDCLAICETLHGALEPARAEDWAGCFAADACAPDRARQCVDGLDCADPDLIAQHCDTLARCGSDGRGWLDEEDCRENPYHEASRWGCLRPERREAVNTCLFGGRCGELGQCLNNAVCGGDGMCATLFGTSLTVDCHRMCDRANYACDAGDPQHYNECWLRCDRASRYLADAHRRAFETCGNEAQCANDAVGWGTEHVLWCLESLECDAAPLRARWDEAVDRCGATPVIGDGVEEWACLGNVLQTAIGACLGGPCDAMDGCLEAATSCGDDPYCLSFFGPFERQPF